MNHIRNLSPQILAAISGVLVTVLVTFVPELQPLQGSLVEILGVIVAYILGMSYKQHAEIQQGRQVK